MADKEPVHIVSWSGGKDSTAMLLRMLELKMPVDIALFADTMFEFPQMYDFHKKFKAYMAKNHPEVLMVEARTKTTWDHWFRGKVTRGKMKGNVRGWPLAYFPCYWSREAKFKVLDPMCKGSFRYIGYAADEKKRLAGIAISDESSGYKSPLSEWGWTEKDCLDYMESLGVAEQIHRDFNRTGCYHCPKQPRSSLEIICEKYPEQWAHIKEMDKQVPNEFNPKYTLKEIEDAVHDRMLGIDTKPEIDIDKIIANSKESKCTECDFIF
jgi:3'-phosphoadenosine 5'-phosphosulfate sulfotransferase (PAPS reductase)/FAD synthetase